MVLKEKERIEEKCGGRTSVDLEKIPKWTEEPPRKAPPIALFVILGIIAILLIGGFAFWLGARGDGISSAERKQNEERIKSLIGEEEWQRVKREGPGLADKLLKDEKSVVPAMPAAPANISVGNWAKTLQTEYGPVEVMVVNWAKDKVVIWAEMQGGSPNYYLKNISQAPITVAVTMTWRRKSDNLIIDKLKVYRNISPGQVYDEGDADQKGATNLDIVLEVP